MNSSIENEQTIYVQNNSGIQIVKVYLEIGDVKMSTILRKVAFLKNFNGRRTRLKRVDQKLDLFINSF